MSLDVQKRIQENEILRQEVENLHNLLSMELKDNNHSLLSNSKNYRKYNLTRASLLCSVIAKYIENEKNIL